VSQIAGSHDDQEMWAMTQSHFERHEDARMKVAAAVARFFAASKAAGLIAGVYPPGSRGREGYWVFSEGSISTTAAKPPDPRTIWQIGSLTKTMTATLLAAAVADGRLALVDPVADFTPSGVVLPSYLDGNGTTTQIRFVDLGTQTSSLPLDPNDVPAGGYTIQSMYAYLKVYALAARSGSIWNYSNVGFGLLANVLASLANFDSFSELFEDWKRKSDLPLDDMVITPNPEQRERLASGYDATGKQAPWRTVTWPAFDGSGALYGTLDDLMVWTAYNLGRLSSPFEGLPDITQRVYFDDGTNMMGLAWQYFPLPGGAGLYLGKDGQTNGFSSFLGLMREQNIGVAILCNNSAAVPQNLASEILQILVEQTEG
jgi:D-alanyl-D-alanine-carboxypeptidase/D-alanyl-D-alanine-endopeptidase